jgi:hypothetical protein
MGLSAHLSNWASEGRALRAPVRAQHVDSVEAAGRNPPRTARLSGDGQKSLFREADSDLDPRPDPTSRPPTRVWGA